MIKATLTDDGKVIADTTPTVGDTIDVETFGQAKVEQLYHIGYSLTSYITVTWEGSFQPRTYRFIVEAKRAA